MRQQREPRDDQLRDKDVIRRYEIGSDVDGTLVGIHVDGNVLSLHEPGRPEKPKFVFVFRNILDLRAFGKRVYEATRERCPECGRVLEPGQMLSTTDSGITQYHAHCLEAKTKKEAESRK
jgi:hypothetical protein